MDEQSIVCIEDEADRYLAVASHLSSEASEKSWEFISLCLRDNEIIQTEALDFVIDNFDTLPANMLGKINALFEQSDVSTLTRGRLWLALAKFGDKKQKYAVMHQKSSQSTYEKIYLNHAKYIISNDDCYRTILEGLRSEDNEFNQLINSILTSCR